MPMASAREEIAHAVADKIRELKTAKELSKVVEEVLPELESFLEPPEEKRLRRMRRGTIASAIGLALGLSFTTAGAIINEEGFIFFGCLGFVLLLMGLGVMLNGWYFTVVEKRDDEPLSEVLQKSLRTGASQPIAPESSAPRSVTDHTTHQLQFPDQPRRGKVNLK
jgi:hypothetical protein